MTTTDVKAMEAMATAASRWVVLKTRVLRLRREREKCESYEPATFGYDGEPECWAAGMDGRHGQNQTALEFSEWCGACQRNQARYLYRQYTQKAMAKAQRKLLKGGLA